MKKITKLTERDLTRLVKRVINEGIINQLTPEELSQNYPNANGTFTIKDGYFEVKMADGKRFGIYSAKN